MKNINLSFDKETNRAFDIYYVSRYVTYTRRVLLGITILFSLSGFFDYLLTAEQLASIFTLRYAIVLPLLFCINLIIFHPFFMRLIQYFILLYMIIVCAFLFYLGVQMDETIRIFYISGLLVTKLVTVSILRLRFFFAISACFIIFFCSQLMLYSMGSNLTNFLLFNYFAGSITLLGLTSNYFLEQSAKIEYLHRKMTDNEIELLENQNLHLEKMAHTDTLTGIANRRAFDEQWLPEWRRAHRSQQPISLILGDIDFFKKYNDHYGHQAGDLCLKSVADILKKFAQRPGDLVARYGGEEFIFLLPNTHLRDATLIADRLIKAIEEEEIPHISSPIKDTLSLSFGVACIDFSHININLEDIIATDLIRQADKNLYLAKDQGRNRHVSSDLLANFI